MREFAILCTQDASLRFRPYKTPRISYRSPNTPLALENITYHQAGYQKNPVLSSPNPGRNHVCNFISNSYDILIRLLTGKRHAWRSACARVRAVRNVVVHVVVRHHTGRSRLLECAFSTPLQSSLCRICCSRRRACGTPTRQTATLLAFRQSISLAC